LKVGDSTKEKPLRISENVTFRSAWSIRRVT
jgi:hypothetical protein